MIFMLMPWVCRLEAVCPGVDLQHVRDDSFERSVVHTRTLVDAVAGVKTDSFRWKATHALIDGFNKHVRPAIALGRTERGVGEDVGQERIVDLEY
jgi:hypothetical protein